MERPKIEGEALIELIKTIHGSYWPVWKIRDAFQKLYPKISARIIKKKLTSIATKEKRNNDLKVDSLFTGIETLLRKERVVPGRNQGRRTEYVFREEWG